MPQTLVNFVWILCVYEIHDMVRLVDRQPFDVAMTPTALLDTVLYQHGISAKSEDHGAGNQTISDFFDQWISLFGALSVCVAPLVPWLAYRVVHGCSVVNIVAVTSRVLPTLLLRQESTLIVRV